MPGRDFIMAEKVDGQRLTMNFWLSPAAIRETSRPQNTPARALSPTFRSIALTNVVFTTANVYSNLTMVTGSLLEQPHLSNWLIYFCRIECSNHAT
jgi:hypothetical protein